jgi:hypothetical protein
MVCENKKLATDFPPFHAAGQIFTDFLLLSLETNKFVEDCIKLWMNIRV